MTDDLLRRATAALREQGETLDGGARTRARVLLALHERKRKRRTRWALGAPLLILFGGSTAWASASGKLPQVVQVLTAPFTFASYTPPPEAAAKPPPRRASAHARTVEAPAEPSAPEVAPASAEPLDDASGPPIAPAPTSAPQTVTAAPVAASGAGGERRPAPAAGSAAATSASRATNVPKLVERTPELPDALSLYRSAHRAHFVERDPARALAGYEAYLAAAPSGPFALEARYNRALCLVRVGRHAAARIALEPFAQGRFGGYRRDEARRLIDATLGDTAAR